MLMLILCSGSGRVTVLDAPEMISPANLQAAATAPKTQDGDYRSSDYSRDYDYDDYRQNNYSPTNALRGSVSLLLEIPFFIAAYHFLSNLELLRGVRSEFNTS